VTKEQLRRFLRQWYTFGIRFRKVLIGPLYNLSDKLAEPAAQNRHYRFRYVEVRRGAVFEGSPASQTAGL